VFPRDKDCLRNIRVDTLLKGDTNDDDDDYDDDDDNNNNNIIIIIIVWKQNNISAASITFCCKHFLRVKLILDLLACLFPVLRRCWGFDRMWIK
jgi:hypothetical protein